MFFRLKYHRLNCLGECTKITFENIQILNPPQTAILLSCCFTVFAGLVRSNHKHPYEIPHRLRLRRYAQSKSRVP